jgi:hypothetical protein
MVKVYSIDLHLFCVSMVINVRDLEGHVQVFSGVKL